MTIYARMQEIEEWTVLVGTPGMGTTSATTNARGGVAFTGGTEDAEYGETVAFSSGDFWTHFVMRPGLFPGSGRNFVKFYSGGTQRLALYTLTQDPASIELRRWNGSAWVSLTTTVVTVIAGNGPIYTFDVYIKLGVSGEFRLYINNVPKAAYTGDLSFVSTIDKIRFQCSGTTSNSTPYYNEIIVADWNTLGSKIVTKTADANGTYAEWTGAGYTLIDEVVAATDYMTSPTADQRFSFSSADFPALASGENIENVRLAYVALRDAAGPQNINGFARVSSTDYHASDQTLSVSPTYHYVDWDTNPAGGAWTVSALNASEFGLRSRT